VTKEKEGAACGEYSKGHVRKKIKKGSPGKEPALVMTGKAWGGSGRKAENWELPGRNVGPLGSGYY